MPAKCIDERFTDIENLYDELKHQIANQTQGPQGIQGEPGPPGIGLKGDKGDPGPPGPEGVLSQAWAEGTEPGGPGTLSAREYAEIAATEALTGYGLRFPLEVGTSGVYADFTSKQAATVVAGSLTDSLVTNAPAPFTYANPSASFELDSAGVMGARAANQPCYSNGQGGAVEGLAIRQPSVSLLGWPNDFRTPSPGGSIVFWSEESGTDIGAPDVDGLFGADSVTKIICNPVVANKRLQQTQVVEMGKLYTRVHHIASGSTVRKYRILSPSSRVASSPVVSFDLDTGVTSATSTANLKGAGIIWMGPDEALIWATFEATSSGNGVWGVYFCDDNWNYAWSGAVDNSDFTLCGYSDLLESTGPRMPIQKASAGDVVYAGQSLSIDDSELPDVGPRFGIMLDLNNGQAGGESGWVYSASTGAITNQIGVRLVNNAYQLVLIDDSVEVATDTGPVRGLVDRLSVGVDLNLGYAFLAVNGKKQAEINFPANPFTPTRFAVGCNGALGQQANIVVQKVQLASDSYAEEEALIRASKIDGVVSPADYDRSLMLVVVTPTEIVITHMGTVPDSTAALSHHITRYTNPATYDSAGLGWARSTLALTNRAGLLTTGLESKIFHGQRAIDNSMRIANPDGLGGWVDASDFIAIGAHGTLRQKNFETTPAQALFVDGKSVSLNANSVHLAKEVVLTQRCEAFNPDDLAMQVADTWQEWKYTPARLEYTNTWKWLEAVRVKSGSYLTMNANQIFATPPKVGEQRVSAIHVRPDLHVALDPTVDNSTIRTFDPMMFNVGPELSTRFSIVKGFQAGSYLDQQTNPLSTAFGKQYCFYLPTDVTVAVGDTWSQTAVYDYYLNI